MGCKHPLIFMYYLVVLLAVVLDQGIKLLIRSNMQLIESIPIIEGFFHITYIQNRGGAFSILEGHTGVLILLPILFTTAILIYLYKNRVRESWSVLLSLALIAGGGIGNLVDRIRFGAVVDFLDFRVFPIFNVADICVCMGSGLLLLAVLFPKKFVKKDRRLEYGK